MPKGDFSQKVRIDGTAKGFKSAAEDAARASEKLAARTQASNKKANKSITDIISSYGKMAIAAAAAFVTTRVVNFTTEIIKLASKAEGVSTAFKKIASPELLNDLRKATRGTVSDMVLMQKTVQASNFKIPLDTLATAFQFATNRAIETGQEVDYLVDSIVSGIGKKSSMILDNLGIGLVEIQNELKVTSDYATAIGNIMKRSMTETGNVASTTATKIQSIAAAWENMKVAWGNFITGSSGFAKILDNIATRFEIAADPELSKAMKWTISPVEYRELQKYNQELQKYFGLIAGKHAFTSGAKAWTPFKDRAAEDAKKLTVPDEALKSIDDYVKQIKAAAIEAEKMAEAWKIIRGEINPQGVPSRIEGLTAPTLGAVPSLPGLQPKQIEKVAESIYFVNEAVYTLERGFDELFSSTEKGFQHMAESIIQSIEQIASTIIAKAAIFAIFSAIPGVNLGTFGSFVLGSFATPKTATAGNIMPGGAAQPGQLNINVTGRISGKDINFTNERYKQWHG